MRHPTAWTKPFSYLNLTGAQLEGAYHETSGRKATEAEARHREIALKRITPAGTLQGRGHVLLFGSGSRPNTVVLAAERPGNDHVEVELEGRSRNYRTRTPLAPLHQLLTQVERDYPASTVPGCACAALDRAVLT